MARTDSLGNFLTDVADAIRTKKGSSDTILASDFDTEIENLPSGGSKKYERPTDWWDTKTILQNAEAITDNGTTYYPAFILLIDDYDESTTPYSGDAYIYSDNPTTLVASSSAHIWDKTKDKACSRGYKTRYILGYVTNTTSSRNIGFGSSRILECILGGFTPSAGFSFASNNYIENFETLSTCNLTTFTGSFNACRILQHVYMPTVTSISGTNQMFKDSAGIVEIDFPNLETISGNYMFAFLRSVSTINMPKLTTIYATNCFMGCSALQEVSLPELTTISGTQAFQECFSLVSINFPKLETISGSYTFRYCHCLNNVSLPKLKTISGTEAFNECFAMSNASMPALQTITTNNTFKNCYALRLFHFPSTVTSIYAGTFYNNVNATGITVAEEWNVALSLSGCTLSRDEMLAIFNNLKDLTGQSSKTLTLGSANLNKLSESDKAIATNKNWALGQ